MKLPEPRGIGFGYTALLPAELYSSGLLDFVELTPETLCRQQRDPRGSRIELIDELLDRAQSTCETLPMAIHGVELSIGSAHAYNTAYLDMLESLQSVWPFMWHSEHLSFQTMLERDGTITEIGIPLPLPPTRESVCLVAQRAANIKARFGVPFLLENPAHYLSELPSDPEVADEIALMHQILDASDCGQLLDLHNLYCNSVNHHLNALDLIDRTNLERVVEIHVAGGVWTDDFWTDAHNGAVPAAVWDLLDYTLPRTPNVAGVVFEIMDEHAPDFGVHAIERELLRLRDAWQRHA